MKIHAEALTLELEAQATMALDGDIGIRLEASRGMLWVTQDGDPRDVVVTPERPYRLDRCGRAVVFALVPSTVRIDQPDRAATAAPQRRRVWDWLRGAPAATHMVCTA